MELRYYIGQTVRPRCVPGFCPFYRFCDRRAVIVVNNNVVPKSCQADGNVAPHPAQPNNANLHDVSLAFSL